MTTVSGRRHEIVQAALSLLVADADPAPSVREIAAAAFCSPASIYSHFDDLDEVLGLARLELFAKLLEAMADAMHINPTSSVAERIHRCNEVLVDDVVANPRLYAWAAATAGIRRVDCVLMATEFIEREFGLDPLEASSFIGALMRSLSVLPFVAEELTCAPSVMERADIVRCVERLEIAVSRLVLGDEGFDRMMRGEASTTNRVRNL